MGHENGSHRSRRVGLDGPERRLVRPTGGGEHVVRIESRPARLLRRGAAAQPAPAPPVALDPATALEVRIPAPLRRHALQVSFLIDHFFLDETTTQCPTCGFFHLVACWGIVSFFFCFFFGRTQGIVPGSRAGRVPTARPTAVDQSRRQLPRHGRQGGDSTLSPPLPCLTGRLGPLRCRRSRNGTPAPRLVRRSQS